MTQPIFPASMSAIMRWNEGRLKFVPRPAIVHIFTDYMKPLFLCVLLQDCPLRRDLSRSVFAKQCAIRIDKQQKERYNNVVIDNDVII